MIPGFEHPTENVTTTIRFTLKPDTAEAFLSGLEAFVKATRNYPGLKEARIVGYSSRMVETLSSSPSRS